MCETELRTRVESEYARPFDLLRGPLIRASVFSRGPEHPVFVLTVHHIVADGRSLFMLMRALYEEAAGGVPASLATDRRKKEAANHDRFEQRMDERLARLQAAAQSRRLRSRDVLQQGLGRLKLEYSRVARAYRFHVEGDGDALS
jgi:Condensation domain